MITMPSTTRTMPVARFRVLASALLAKTAAMRAHSRVNRMQDDFIRRLMAGLEEEKLEIFFEVIDTMNENLDAILEGEE